MRILPAGGGGADPGSDFQHGARWRRRRPHGPGAERRPLGSLGVRGPRETASACEWCPSPPSETPSSGPHRPAPPTRAPPGPTSGSPSSVSESQTTDLSPPGSRMVVPARDPRPQFPPLTWLIGILPLPLPLPVGGGRPHLPGPGENPLWQRPCHLQRLPGDYEGVQKPKVPVGPLSTPGGLHRAERRGSPQLGDLAQVVEPLGTSVPSSKKRECRVPSLWSCYGNSWKEGRCGGEAGQNSKVFLQNFDF